MTISNSTLSPKDVARFWAKVDRSGGPDACWPWTGTKNKDGYGGFRAVGKMHKSHRVAWTIAHGEIPGGYCVLHHCDNPPCCNPSSLHLWLGTNDDNTADKCAKGRQAKGDTHNSRTHPEKMRQLRGDEHYSRLHPERLSRGCDHYTRLHPELVMRGETHGHAKLTTENVRSIRARYALGETQRAVAVSFGISSTHVRRIVRRANWKHVL